MESEISGFDDRTFDGTLTPDLNYLSTDSSLSCQPGKADVRAGSNARQHF